MATARFGGRNFAVLSSLILVIPTVGAILLLANPGLPLWPYLLCAALSGWAAQITPRRWPTSKPSSRSGSRVSRWVSPAGSVTSARRPSRRSACRAGHRRPRGARTGYARSTWWLLAVAGLGAAVFMNNLRSLHRDGPPAVHPCGARLVGDLVSLHVRVRLVHRFRIRVRPSDPAQLVGQRAKLRAGVVARRRDRLHRAAAGVRGASRRREVGRPLRWRPGCPGLAGRA